MLKTKIAQMLMIGFHGTDVKPDDAIVQIIMGQHIGGVILFDYHYPSKTFDHNIKNPEQVKALTQQLQEYTKQAASIHHNALVPLLIGIDYEGGRVNRLHERYGFPATLSAAEIAASSTEDAHRYARTMAKTLKDTGINLNFAPVLDVNTNPVNPVIGQLGRSYSADIQKVIECAAIFAKAFHEEGILCAGKHFPGHGSSSGDTHAGFVDITQTWNQSELEPYIKLLHEPFGPPLVMTSHVVHYGLDTAGLPASLSTAITQDLLRGKLNFQGAVITDDMQMKAITDNYGLADAVCLAVNAGADILVFGNQLSILNDPSEVIDIIHRAVIDGKIAESRINEAYQRVLRLKAQIKVKQGHSHSDSHFTSPNVNH